METIYGMTYSGEPESELYYSSLLKNINFSEGLNYTRRLNKVKLSIMNDKYKELYNYTNNHIRLVSQLMSNLGFNQVGMNHDADKWDEEMIVAYLNHFHNPHPTKAMDSLFDKMKYNHISKNAHHPEHWRNRHEVMDVVSWMEMICDWISAGVNTKKNIIDYKRLDTKEYYESKNKHLLDFMPSIKDATEDWLDKYISGKDFTRFDLYNIYHNYVK